MTRALSLATALLLGGCCVDDVCIGPVDDPTLVATTDPTGPTGPTDRSIRLLLFNARFVPDGNDVSDTVFADDAARAQHIVDRLVAGMPELDPDVIVFNEAFDVDAQRVLSSGLCASHPYHSRYIDEEDDGTHQDSGLVILSRHPFAPLGLTDPDLEAQDHLTFTQCVADDADEDDPAYWGDLGFHLYESCSNTLEDCSANKGAAAARFQHNGTGELFNVVFTHLQADGDEAAIEARVEQMADIRTLIEAIPDWDRQRTFVIGDLNVKGIGCGAGGCEAPSDGEWEDHFGAGGDFFACGSGPCTASRAFVDSHGFAMPATDVGRTYHGYDTTFLNRLDGNRYDYVLHNVPEERWVCMQHLRVLREAVLDPNGTPVSDHYPILADYNWRGDHCSPVTAAVVPDVAVHDHGGATQYPGSVQWLRIDRAGTWSLEFPSHVGVEVYAADDLSEEAAADPESFSPRWETFRLPEPPYYVKAMADDPMYTGTWSARAIRHACGEADPCGLTPGDATGVDATWDDGAAIGTSSRWFFFDTDVGERGDPPEIDLHVTGECTSALELRLHDDSGDPVPFTHVSAGAVSTSVSGAADALAPGRYRLEVHRADNSDQPGCSIQVRYETTLTYASFGTLVCDDETGGSGGPAEEIGHDEIWYRMAVDGGCPASAAPSTYSYLYEDDAKAMDLHSTLGQRRYTGCWRLSLLEEDDISEGDVTFLGEDRDVGTLDPAVRSASRDLVWEQGDYRYRVRTTLTHEPDLP